MRIAVIGTRRPKYPNSVWLCLNTFAKTGDTIVSGGAKGIDEQAKEFAKTLGLEYVEFLPNYEEFGDKAPLVRNKLIAETCDVMIAFPADMSSGTWHCARLAIKSKKRVIIIKTEREI